jgi:hypothetical protein
MKPKPPAPPIVRFGDAPSPAHFDVDDSPDDDEAIETPWPIAAMLGFDPRGGGGRFDVMELMRLTNLRVILPSP